MPTALIVLAAGQGSRMQSDLPKVLHQVAHAPLLVHALIAGQSLSPDRTVIVAGHGGDAVEAAARDHDPEATVVRQTEQLGTGHAVQQAQAALDGFAGDAIVLYGDTPFIRAETLQAMLDARAAGADVVVLGFEAADPGRYGRLVADGDRLERIVEAKDATPDELSIRLCNSGVLAADAATLFALLDQVGNDNASGEYYLTDVIGLARAARLSARVVTCPEAETMGVNTRMDLAAAEATFQTRKRTEAMENGATLTAPETVFFAHDTYLGRDVIVEPNVVFGPGVTVESGATLRAFSHLEGCHVSEGCVIGPYARLRPGAELDRGAKIGNFVEVKNAQVHEGAKINHLTYVGDAEVGARANIGAGTVTCNYDGYFKHRTEIGEDAFIGSSTMLVAPVRVGAGAMTGSGSVITMDVADGALALGRAQQVTREGFATRLRAKLKAAKEKR
ncbi:bifunctional UDP-N-acetylglucosamine diphosphorylase/glucosamine-1-phosphate N-acetyltransferase GlmU [Jannaschia sp. M317]|uniref:bifunctional UDP-N-acetylglucosamine diphosphorylase/glucosamine-1-phosphate N-acetyltransferase GlmU n=1 Tax=Jannaschia sp. M317 TaxID=2867011 RepID=UPI0021A575DC|nr:bifunctional UDP-N-acetylglucosamine diphosphorylase/glucosamine-1-phosphate N-acetyltransferase GlmU [Jannaschia sp. M317]UWQ17656.1 bifunctional UDP-N-acetylglucosamine diphosphorylase/glucosamine-1-phosphate N-acetyltransferase GlmU [Jannaschia sp. M317]